MANSKAVLMPKRHLLAISALILLAFISGCTLGETTSALPFVTTADGSAIEDFYFVYETGRLQDFAEGIGIVMLDTENNVIGSWGRTESEHEPGKYYTKYCYIDYHIPLDLLQELYDDIIKYDIKSYSGPDVLIDKTVGVIDYFRITFRINGEVYSVFAEDSVCRPRFVYEDDIPPHLRDGPITQAIAADKNVNLCTFLKLIINKYYDNDAYRTFEASDCVC